MEKDLEQAYKRAQPIYERLVVDMADWLKEWTVENVPRGEGAVGVVGLLAGMGTSCGMLITQLTRNGQLSRSLALEILNSKLNKELNRIEGASGE